MLCLQRYNYVVWYNNIGVVIKVTGSMFVWCVAVRSSNNSMCTVVVVGAEVELGISM